MSTDSLNWIETTIFAGIVCTPAVLLVVGPSSLFLGCAIIVAIGIGMQGVVQSRRGQK